MEQKGHCRHGEFNLLEGCVQCVAERRTAGIRPGQDEKEGGLNEDKSETTYSVAIRVKPETDIQVSQFYQAALKAKEYAEARVIAIAEDLKLAVDDLSLIARLKKAMDEKRKEYLKPLDDHRKAINDTFKTLMEPIETADQITRGKILTFQVGQRILREEQERINALRLEAAEKEMKLKGELSESVNLVEVIPEIPETIRAELGTVGERAHWIFEIVDFTLLPDEYKMPDATKIGRVVRAGLHIIPGVRIWDEPILAVHSK